MMEPFEVSRADQAALRNLAVHAVRSASAGLSSQPPDDIPVSSAVLCGLGAAFVTLRKSGNLRGCIGTLRFEQPLWKSVWDSAWSAAREDPRFAPVSADEVAGLDIEISVLSPLREIAAPDQFSPGDHGIVIERAGRRGVFLPKVAEEMGWDRDQTLSALCKKAGLPVNAWQQPDSRFWIFSACSFGRPPCGPNSEPRSAPGL